jgi:hypothetical protein
VLEHCDHCLAPAPSWELPEYADWHLGVSESGDYLGVVCSGCFAGEELSFVEAHAVETPDSVLSPMSRLGSAARSARGAATSAAGSILASAVSLLEPLRHLGALRSHAPGR